MFMFVLVNKTVQYLSCGPEAKCNGQTLHSDNRTLQNRVLPSGKDCPALPWAQYHAQALLGRAFVALGQIMPGTVHSSTRLFAVC